MYEPFKTVAREHRGHILTLNWYYDHDHGAPWEENDGHGVVSKYEHRDKRPHERILNEDYNRKCFYDVRASMAKALAEGWDAEPYKKGTKREQAARAVEADFKYLKRWCDEQWYWVGYTLKIEGMECDNESLWGIESDSMDEFEKDVFAEAISYIDHEKDASHDAACRDIETVCA